jgi:hypothetical protein
MSSNTFWVQKVWEPEKWVSGKGFWGLGKVVKTRFHTVTTKDAIHRFGSPLFHDFSFIIIRLL